MSASLDGVRGPVEIPRLPGTMRVARKDERPDEEARKRKQPPPKPAVSAQAADESSPDESNQGEGHMDCLV